MSIGACQRRYEYVEIINFHWTHAFFKFYLIQCFYIVDVTYVCEYNVYFFHFFDVFLRYLSTHKFSASQLPLVKRSTDYLIPIKCNFLIYYENFLQDFIILISIHYHIKPPFIQSLFLLVLSNTSHFELLSRPPEQSIGFSRRIFSSIFKLSSYA